MKIRVVYFLYMVSGKWKSFIDEQLGDLKSLSLYDQSCSIDMEILADNIEISEIDSLKSLLREEYPKINYNITNDNFFEYAAFKKMYDISQEDDDCLILYFHSKGITSDSTSIRHELYDNTIKNFEDYIIEFDKNPDIDLAGLYPHTNGFIYYNFFWVRSSFIKKYCNEPKPSNDRYLWEVWFPKNKKENISLYSPVFKYDIKNVYHRKVISEEKIKEMIEFMNKNNIMTKVISFE